MCESCIDAWVSKETDIDVSLGVFQELANLEQVRAFMTWQWI